MTAGKGRVIPASLGPTLPSAFSPWQAEQPRSEKSSLPRAGLPTNPFAGFGPEATHCSPWAAATAVAAISFTVNVLAAGFAVPVGASALREGAVAFGESGCAVRVGDGATGVDVELGEDAIGDGEAAAAVWFVPGWVGFRGGVAAERHDTTARATIARALTSSERVTTFLRAIAEGRNAAALNTLADVLFEGPEVRDQRFGARVSRRPFLRQRLQHDGLRRVRDGRIELGRRRRGDDQVGLEQRSRVV